MDIIFTAKQFNLPGRIHGVTFIYDPFLFLKNFDIMNITRAITNIIPIVAVHMPALKTDPIASHPETNIAAIINTADDKGSFVVHTM